MTDDTVSVEPATDADLPAMWAIQSRALAEPSPALLEAIVNGTGIALVARADRPVGYASAVVTSEVAYVPELAVLESYRREGIGTRLLERISDQARVAEADTLRLTVRAADGDARAFYRDRDFTVVDRHPDHYETGSGVGLTLARSL